MDKRLKLLAGFVVVVAAFGVPMFLKQSKPQASPATTVPPPPGATAVVSTLPKFLDLGTTTCAPCKAMLVVMKELETQFPKKLEVQFINVHENPDALNAYGVSVIPAQIFYTSDGRELFRHTGFISSEDAVAKWKELGYDFRAESAAAGAASP